MSVSFTCAFSKYAPATKPGGAAMMCAAAPGHKVTQTTAVSGATTTITTGALNADGAAHVPQKLNGICYQRMRRGLNRAAEGVRANTKGQGLIPLRTVAHEDKKFWEFAA